MSVRQTSILKIDKQKYYIFHSSYGYWFQLDKHPRADNQTYETEKEAVEAVKTYHNTHRTMEAEHLTIIQAIEKNSGQSRKIN